MVCVRLSAASFLRQCSIGSRRCLAEPWVLGASAGTLLLLNGVIISCGGGGDCESRIEGSGDSSMRK